MKKTLTILLLIVLCSCASEDEGENNPNSDPSDNNSPTPPTLITPNDDETIITQLNEEEVYFEWNNATDPDNDIEGYRIWIDSDPNFSNPFNHFTEFTNTTTYLQTNQQYFWRVTSRDSYGNISDYSQIWSFSLEEQETTNNNIPPSPPTLITPNNDSTIITQEANEEVFFQWNNAIDPDNDVVSYRIWIDSDPSFSDPLNYSIVDTNTIAYLEPNQQYYWRVTATDSNNNLSNYSETWSFYLENGLIPTAPTLLFPLNETECANEALTFQWNPSNDLNGSNISYTLFVSNSSDFSGNVETYVTQNTYYTLNLPASTSLYWKVEASNGSNSNTSDTWSLYTQGEGVANTLPQLEYIYPEDGATISDLSPLLQWTASDNETNENNLDYRVYFAEAGDDFQLIMEDTGITSLQLSTLNFGTTYFWAVWVTDESGATNIGEIRTFTVQ